MGREVRRVPPDWEHPKNEHGYYIPMFERFPYNEAEIAEGLREEWLRGDPPHYGISCMPNWPEAERTHYQMYESTTEGTPISPVMPTPEALAEWLVANNVGAFASITASYEAWLRVAKGGYAPDLVIIRGKAITGVEGL